MSKLKDEIAIELFEYLDKHLSTEAKAQLPATLISDIVHHSTDFLLIKRLSDIFDQAILLEEALIESQRQQEDSDEEDSDFIDQLKKL